MNTKNTFSAVIYKEDDMFVATCPELDVASQGETIEEAFANLQEAVELYLEENKSYSQIYRNCFVTTFEVPQYA